MTRHPSLFDYAAACCVAVMCKAPARAKRRLAAEIGARAADAARHLYQCVLEDVADWPGVICLAPSEAADLAELERPAHTRLLTVVQRGGNLGERIGHVDAALRAAGCGRRIFVGADSAELDPPYLHAAAAALAATDVVLGPARDGGVVLMGAGPAWPDLAALPWSTSALCAELQRLCDRHGLRTALLEQRGDVDSLADLAAAAARLASDRRPARRAFHRWLHAQPELARA